MSDNHTGVLSVFKNHTITLITPLLVHKNQKVRSSVMDLFADLAKEDPHYQLVQKEINAAWKTFGAAAFPDYDPPEIKPQPTDVNDF